MGMSRIPRFTRRRFLKETGLTLAAASAAPLISAPFVSRALADTKTLTIVQWSHFVPAYDKWFDQFAKDWGTKNNIDSYGRPHPGAGRGRARSRRGVGRIGARYVRMERRRRRASLPEVPCRRHELRRVRREEVRQDQRHREADRLQPGRQDLVGISRLLHQLPGHVPQEPVGRDRGGAGYVGRHSDRRRQAEGERQSGRNFARPQQRSEHHMARFVVELWRLRTGRNRQARHARQQGDGRGGEIRRRALQGGDDAGRAVLERRQQQPVHRFPASAR